MFSTVTALGITNGEPVLQYTPEGDAILRFYLHVIRYYTYNGEDQNDYILLGVQVSGEEAERLNQDSIKPYQQVLVSGYLVGDESGGPEIVFRQGGPWPFSLHHPGHLRLSPPPVSRPTRWSSGWPVTPK